MPGNSKYDKEIEKQNETLEKILNKLTALECQIDELKSENKALSMQVSELKTDNKALKTTLSEIKDDNKLLITRVNSLEKLDSEKQKEIDTLKSRVIEIENTLEDFEQNSKVDNLVVTGLKIVRPYNATALLVNDQNRQEVDDEGKEQWSARDKDIMLDNFIKFSKDKLEIDINRQDIADIHTLPRKDRTMDTCIVRFANRISREKVIRNRHKLKTTSRNAHKIYINEHLSRKNAQIAKEARALRKEGKIIGTWTKNCRVLVKKLDETIIKVNSLAILHSALQT